MKYIEQWLCGLGLEYIIPKLQENGITTPKKLAQLSLRDMYSFGVEDAEDRKKLYYLIQRLQAILNKDQKKVKEDGEIDIPKESSVEIDEKPEIIDPPKPATVINDSSSALTASQESSLQLLRKQQLQKKIQLNRPSPGSLGQRAPSPIQTQPREVPIASDKPSIVSEPVLRDLKDRRISALHEDMHTPDVASSRDHHVAEIRKSEGPGIIEEDQVKDSVRKRSDSLSAEGVVDMPIRVVVRKRPLNKKEQMRNEVDIIETLPEGVVLVHEMKVKVDLSKFVETNEFTFDDSYGDEDTNESVYSRTVAPLVAGVFQGGKATCFAYGQTGSGKTHTMMGTMSVDGVIENPGLYVLAARDIFNLLQSPGYEHSFALKASCFEIYGGKLFDLLNDRLLIKCLEDGQQQVQLVGLTEHLVGDVDELLELMSKAHALRSTGSTSVNSESSRSHQILQLSIKETKEVACNSNVKVVHKGSKYSNRKEIVEVEFGKLSFIDLAGSEKASDSSNSSKQTRMEGAEINTSLLALKEVIRSLERNKKESDSTGFTPFRGSKLTQVLKDSFVGKNTRTCMIACITPSNVNAEHTLNTLRYADRVKEHHPRAGSAAAPASEVENTPVAPARPQTAGAGDLSGDKNRLSSLLNKLHLSPPSAPQSSASSNAAVPNMPTKIAVSRPSTANSTAPRTSLSGNLGVAQPETAEPPVQKRFTSPLKAAANKNIRQSIGVRSSEGEAAPVALISAKRPSQLEVPAAKPKVFLSEELFSPKNNAKRIQKPEKLPEDDGVLDAKVKSSVMRSPGRPNGKRASIELKAEPVEKAVEPISLAQQHQLALKLLHAHKLSIAEMVEVMKDEMELVQDMENDSEDRDAENYVGNLEKILAAKSAAILSLRSELRKFQNIRTSSKDHK